MPKLMQDKGLKVMPIFMTKTTNVHEYQGPISRTDLSLLWGLNLMQSDSWLGLSLFVKSAQ